MIFGVQNYSKILNLTSNSLYGTPTQLKSVILNSRGLDNTIGYGPEDAYPAIHDAVTTYEFRDGVQRKIVLFADEVILLCHLQIYRYHSNLSIKSLFEQLRNFLKYQNFKFISCFRYFL